VGCEVDMLLMPVCAYITAIYFSSIPSSSFQVNSRLFLICTRVGGAIAPGQWRARLPSTD
jgi:hypothetical protein